MAERTNAERNWETTRNEEQARRESGETMRSEARGREGYREGSIGGGYQPSSYELGGRGGYASGWQLAGPADYPEGGSYAQRERGSYGRPPGFRYQGTGYGVSSGYNAELDAGEWAGRPGADFRPSGFGIGGREAAGQRGGPWAGQWRGGETGGWGGERGSYGGAWRGEGPWDQDRGFGEEGSWSGGGGFRSGYGGYTGPRGGGYARWQGGEGGWRGGAAPGYPAGPWGRRGYGEGRGPDWGWQAAQGPGSFAGEGWGEEHGRMGAYGPAARSGWTGGAPDWEDGPWAGRGEREWGEAGRGMAGVAAYGDLWSIPGPFTGRGPEGYQRSGDSIRDDVCERLTRHGHVDASGIRVRVENAEVVLEGTVPDRRTKRLAEDVAESVSGVRDVQNRLRVSERDEGRGSDTGAGVRGEQIGSRAGNTSDATRTGRPERDAEKQKATARAKG